MVKRRLKYPYLLLLVGSLFVIPLLMLGTIVKTNLNEEEVINYQEEEIENYQPVVDTTKKIILPFLDPGVTIAKTYYDYKDNETSQLNSILFHDNMYLQNTGIDYIGEKNFDVIAILEGTVVTVKNDELRGKIVEIEHKEGYISSYQSLKEVNVKKGDIVSQGQVLGISGENELEKDLGNHLHFEIYENGQSINPNNYLNKEISYEKGN